MTTLAQYEQYSHTTRSFDLSRPVDAVLKTKINRIISANKEHLQYAFVLEDPVIIEKMYQISDIPNEAEIGIPYFARKNSQLLAPMLLLLVPFGNDNYSSYIAGKTYSIIGLTAIEAGHDTAFCICYDREQAKEILGDAVSESHYLPLGAIFMAVGHKVAGVTRQTDLKENIVVKSVTKANRNYIKFVG